MPIEASRRLDAVLRRRLCAALAPVNFAPRVEACRFLSENKSAGAIDKPAQQEYAVVNKDARSWLQRTFLESRYGLRSRRLKSYKRRGLPFAGTEKPLCLLDKAAVLHIMRLEGRCR